MTANTSSCYNSAHGVLCALNLVAASLHLPAFERVFLCLEAELSFYDDLDEDELAELENLSTAYLDELCGYKKRRSDYERRSWEDIEAEQAGIAWDLGVSLPAGHPFAPVVDGKHAA